MIEKSMSPKSSVVVLRWNRKERALRLGEEMLSLVDELVNVLFMSGRQMYSQTVHPGEKELSVKSMISASWSVCSPTLTHG